MAPLRDGEPYEPSHQIPHNQRTVKGGKGQKEIEEILRQEGRPKAIIPKGAKKWTVIFIWKRQDEQILKYGGGSATNTEELLAALGPDHEEMDEIEIPKTEEEVANYGPNAPSANTNGPARPREPTKQEMKDDFKAWGLNFGSKCRTLELMRKKWNAAKLLRETGAAGKDASPSDDTDDNHESEGQDEQSPKAPPAIKPRTKKRRHDEGEAQTRKRAKVNGNTTHNFPPVETEVQSPNPKHDAAGDINMREDLADEPSVQEQIPEHDVDTEMHEDSTDERPLQAQRPEHDRDVDMGGTNESAHGNPGGSETVAEQRPVPRITLKLQKDQAPTEGSGDHKSGDDTEVVAKKRLTRAATRKRTTAPLSTSTRQSRRPKVPDEVPEAMELQDEALEDVAPEVEAHERGDDTGSPPHKYGKRLYHRPAMGKTDYYPMEPHPLEATILDHEIDWAALKARNLLRAKAEREEAKAKGEPYVPKKVQQPKRKRPTLEDFQNRTKRFDRDGKLLVEMKGGKIIRRLDPGE
jgi:hypothetical protein